MKNPGTHTVASSFTEHKSKSNVTNDQLSARKSSYSNVTKKDKDEMMEALMEEHDTVRSRFRGTSQSSGRKQQVSISEQSPFRVDNDINMSSR